MKPTVLQQLVKFLIVGGSSFVIDLGVRTTLLHGIHIGSQSLGDVFGRWVMGISPSTFSQIQDPSKVAFPFAAAIAASLAMVNSFLLNRSWTFEIRGTEERAAQAKRFIVVSLIGAGINILSGSIFNFLIPGESRQTSVIATVLAAILAAAWNFYGQRRFAFRAETA